MKYNNEINRLKPFTEVFLKKRIRRRNRRRRQTLSKRVWIGADEGPKEKLYVVVARNPELELDLDLEGGDEELSHRIPLSSFILRCTIKCPTNM